MLVALSIRNIVLVDQLTLTLGSGLSALTGETGAGKSILLDALGLAIGAKSEARHVRPGADQASVAASFDLPSDHQAYTILSEQGFVGEDELVLRRTINADGRSRAFVNDQPASAGLLRRLGQTLVEIHGQFDTQGLLNPATHRGLLDGFGGVDASKAAGRWKEWQSARDALAEALENAERARTEEAFLRHAVEELDQLDPGPDEEERLAAERSLLMHREQLMEALGTAVEVLDGDQGASPALATAQRALERLADKAGQRLEAPLAALGRAASEIEEALASLRGLADDSNLEHSNLESLEERLFALRAAARKHTVEVADLPRVRTEFAERLALIDDQGSALEQLRRRSDQAREAFTAAAQSLSESRRNSAATLDKAVAKELPPLKLDKAKFATRLETLDEADWGASGWDRANFVVATNPGAELGPLNKIASGGELARFMLALKVVLSAQGSVPTLIFDEVDSGVSGAVSAAVGERLARLGRDLQVLVVTHSPQVAAQADHHLRVEKSSSDDATTTHVSTLDADDRREEIARMLSGARITDQARAVADELVGAAPQ
ncbi:MAG: DNA repair protein RecN [Pseudomonadota bacterium]